MESQLPWIGRAAVLAIVAASAWFYGGVEQWFRSTSAAALGLIVFASAALLLLRRRQPGKGVAVAVAAPLGLAILAALQVFGGGVSVESVGGGLVPRTLFPAETRLALGGLLAAAAAAYLGCLLFRDRNAFVALLVALTLIGTATSVLGMGLRLTAEDRLIRGEPVYGDPFAHFVNRNNAAGFLQVCLSGGIALLRTAVGPRGGATTRQSGRRLPADGMTRLFVAVIGTGFCLAGIVASRSRGGTVAAVLTILVVVVSFGGGQKLKRLGLAAAAVVLSLGLLFWLDLAAPAFARFARVTTLDELLDGRISHWRDAFEAVKARPYWGSGAGTYGVAYSEFASHPSSTTFEHADGQFVELAVEAGVFGIAVIAAAGIAVGRCLFPYAPARPAERTALVALIAGQAAHAVFDFAIIVPAVAVAAGLLAGAAIGGLHATDEPIGYPDRARRSRGAAFAIGVVVSGGLLWASMEHGLASDVDRAAGTAGRIARSSPPGVDPFGPIADRLAVSLQLRPDDAEGHRVLADVWVRRYRLAVEKRLRDVDPSLGSAELSRSTDLVSLHRTVNLLARSGAVGGLAAVRDDPLVQEYLVPARRHYQAAAEACPRLPRVWLPLACLSFLNAGSPTGQNEIETELHLFPADPVTLRLGARLAWQAGEANLAGQLWRRTFALNPARFDETLAELTVALDASKAVGMVLPEEATAALHVLVGAERSPQELRRAIGAELAERENELPAGPTRARCAAASAWHLGNEGRAENLFNLAATKYPEDARIRADVARFLAARGRHGEAADAAGLAAALAPSDSEVRETWALLNRSTPEGPRRNVPAGL